MIASTVLFICKLVHSILPFHTAAALVYYTNAYVCINRK